MKVTNNKIGPSASKLDSLKSSKTEASKGLLDSGNASGLKNSPALGSKENVKISEDAQLKAKAENIARQTEIPVDEAKVARLQKLIDEGKYKTDARAIADRLVDAHLETQD